jgi:L-threonylcarbamoyladenylate synthase
MPEDNHRYETRVLDADAPDAIPEAAAALRRGELVVFPTDTVYGVGCDCRDAAAIERLYWAKQRPYELAIPVLVSHPRHVSQVARSLPAAYGALTARFWPGGLTLIVPRQTSLPDILTAGGDTVAVRMPDHDVAQALIEAAGGAVAGTSANLSTRPSPCTAQEALADLERRVHLVLDGGACPQGIASSIVDLCSSPPRLLRGGGLDPEVLREVLPDLVVA